MSCCVLLVLVSPSPAVVRVFTQWMADGHFLNGKAKAGKKKDTSAAMRTLEGLLAQQYKSTHTNIHSVILARVCNP